MLSSLPSCLLNKRINPSHRSKVFFFFPVNITINKNNGARIVTRISILPTTLNFNGLIIELTPKINKILKIFDPRIFPIAISEFFLKAAITDVDNSGSEVPKAMIVIAIND